MPIRKPSPNRITNWLTKPVMFEFGGSDWPLVFTHRALLISEELTGANMLATSVDRASLLLLRALIFSALSTAGAAASEQEVGKVISKIGIRFARAKTFEAWLRSMPDPEASDRASGSSKKFGWIDVWAEARINLHLSDEEWLDMTPRQFRVLQDVHMAEMQRQELMTGILAATIENFSAAHPRKPADPKSFMLHPFKDTQPEVVTGDFIMDQFKRAGYSEKVRNTIQAQENARQKIEETIGNTNGQDRTHV